jgi:predicted Zn finger-like uncharacterized protein
MPIQFQCQSCRSTLRVPDNLAGRKVRCPKCAEVADVPTSKPVAAAPPIEPPQPVMQSSAEPEEVRVRARRRAPAPELEVEDAEEVEERPPRPVRSPPRRAEAISTRPLRRNEPTDADDEDEEEAREVPRPRRLKRRKRKGPHRRSPLSSYGFIWWLVAGGIYLAVGAGVSFYKVAKGEVFELMMDGIGWAILMPVSVFLLIGSMFAASAIAGGIDFGDVRTAIPKAFFLLAPINFIGIVFPWYVSLFFTPPFWIIGLIVLYGLDLWETFFLMTINWFLSLGAKVLVVLIVIAMLHGAQMEKDKLAPDELEDQQIGAPFPKDPPKSNQRLRR